MKTSKEMQACIDECLRCYQMCLGTAMTHCLESGGKHVEPKHIRLMMACARYAELRRTSCFSIRLTMRTSARSAPRSAPNAPRTASASAGWTTA